MNIQEILINHTAKDLNFDEAEKAATLLSQKNWNQYFHIIPQENGFFRITKYYEKGAISYCLRNKYYTHN